MNISDDTREALEMLKRRMSQDVKPILFTGAGFTLGAKNKSGKDIPLGNGLKKMLLTEFLGLDKNSDDFKEVESASLMQVYDLVENQNKIQVRNYLIDLFSEVIPMSFHRDILSYPWQKIYTVNIDDLVENVFNSDSDVRLCPLNSIVPSSNRDRNRLEYIKLHGCVRNHDGGFIFSSESYMEKIEHRLDHRFTKLVEDLQTQDFVFIGTSGDEMDIQSYLLKFGVEENSKRGNIFIVLPNPNIFLKSNAKRSGSHLIDLTAEKFSKWIKENFIPSVNMRSSIRNQRYLRYFFNLRNYIEVHKRDDNSDSRLYMGEHPTWLDVINDYDFKTPLSSKIFKDIIEKLESSREHLIISLLSKAIGGKSVHLKRIGLQLQKNGYEVYQFRGARFSESDFIQMVKGLHNDTVVLLIDDASDYYSVINRIINNFPDNKRIVVVTTSRPYFHYKKYYDIVHFPGFHSYNMDDYYDSKYFSEIGKSAYGTLKNKGLLGKWRKWSQEEVSKEFVKRKDIPEVLWYLFNGTKLRNRFNEAYDSVLKVVDQNRDLEEVELTKDFLIGLALFNYVDLPYLPGSLIILWLKGYKQKIEQRLGDIIKVMDPDGLALRTNYLVSRILGDASHDRILKVIEVILKIIASYIDGDRESYWHQIQSRLMNESFIHKRLKISPKEVRGLFTKLHYYYEEDENYYLQLGRVEQSLGLYDIALNHFQQAECISPNYYNVLNAKARNYLVWAYRGKELDKERAEMYYKEGYSEMLRLIEEKEQYQVRAYSIHSLAVESVNYWRRWNVKPMKEEIIKILDKLKDALSDFHSDERIEYACRKVYLFLKENDLTKLIPAEDNFQLCLYQLAMKKESQDNFSDDDLD